MDPNAEPSLPLAKQHTAQREHIHKHNHNQHQLQHHNHHRSLHKRQAQDVDGVETVSVIQTISVIQQIDIDSNGNTVSTLFTPTPEPISPPILTGDSSIAPSPSGALPPGTDGAESTQVPSTGSPISTSSSSLSPSSSPGPASAQTSTPSTAFPSLVVGSNSTTPRKRYIASV